MKGDDESSFLWVNTKPSRQKSEEGPSLQKSVLIPSLNERSLPLFLENGKKRATWRNTREHFLTKRARQGKEGSSDSFIRRGGKSQATKQPNKFTRHGEEEGMLIY